MTTTKKLLALIACLALVLSSVGLCFAYSPAQLGNGFTPFPWVQSSTRPDSSVYVSDGLGPVNAYIYYLGYSSSLKNIYWCYVHYGNNWQLYVLCDAYFSGISSYNSNFNTFSSSSNSNQAYYSDGTICSGVYSISLTNAQVVDVPLYFDSYDDALDAFVEFRDSGFSTTVGEVVEFSLEPGYAYVIEGACEVSDRTFSLTGTSNLSALSNKNGSVQWFGSVGNIRDDFSPDLNNSDNLVVWSPLNANPSGEASNYSFHATDVINVSSGAAYVITYPLYYGSKYVPTGASAVIQNSVNMSGSVYIEYTGDRPTMRRVALKSEQSYADNFISYYNTFQPSVLNETVSYTVSDDVVIVDPSTAPAGGADAGTPSENVDNTILGVLQRFINNISGLISSGSHAIQELVSLGSSFMMSIAAMFQWLPSGLSTLILTAFTIVLVIGVIKLLWK